MRVWQFLRAGIVTAVLAGTLVVDGAGGNAAMAAGSKPAGAAVNRSSGCSITPSEVSLDQLWDVSAWKLPTRATVEMIINFPDGAQSTGPIVVASDGTYATTGNSDMSASWGLILPEQVGTYTYEFVGRVKWPAGSFSTLYAQCSVLVA
jgi:hypothetical protein